MTSRSKLVVRPLSRKGAVMATPSQATQRQLDRKLSRNGRGGVFMPCTWPFMVCPLLTNISKLLRSYGTSIYIFCVGNYDSCELGRRRRLEIGCFLQLVPFLLITG